MTDPPLLEELFARTLSGMSSTKNCTKSTSSDNPGLIDHCSFIWGNTVVKGSVKGNQTYWVILPYLSTGVIFIPG